MKKQPELDISRILEYVPPGKRGNNARTRIERAYDVAELAHAGQKRKSGESYIQHPLAVALLLTDIGMDTDTIVAGLLHDVVEDNSDIDIEVLGRRFSADVANLVDGVTKLEEIEEQIEQDHIERLVHTQRSERRPRGEQEIESLRKMFIAMAEDIRVVIIKLADRLHNMRTLDALSPERRKSFARETQEIFAPLANRLGIWQWKWELEDLSLRYVAPTTYAEIVSFIRERRPDREDSIQRHIEILKRAVAAEGISADITGRPKHIYSIYRKMQRKGVPFQQIYDVRAIRMITDTESDCYRILGLVHGLWKPIPGEFDDYVATPKGNGYQSLHTAVFCQDGKTLEIQIRTQSMHRIAEYGVAAHWRYKEGGGQNKALETDIPVLRSLVEWRQETIDAKEFVDAMKTDVFQDRVYTFTPKGKLIDLPTDATPIDFAYQIHTEIGHRCRGARVNGKMVSLDYRLKNGDQVEILTTRQKGPSRDWLNPSLRYTTTSRARSKIRQWFRRQNREQNINLGREIVERELKRLGVEHLGHEAVAQLFDYEKSTDFHAAVGFGDINSQQIASKIADTRHHEEVGLPLVPTPPTPTIEGLQVQGTGGLLTRLARCCSPLPGDDVVGYVTRGRGVTIHRRDCPNVLSMRDRERLIEVSWGTRSRTVPVAIRIIAYDRAGLLSEISNVISSEGINIVSLTQDVRQNIATFYLTIEISDITQLSRVLTKIERRTNVTEARRYTG
ncbi:MAG: bifunctional (p)ppGpp synthetase/guanosine-3',5'-bis(diphosphate) 3'-pyrophosphohydrolase [Chloroflexi bacterium]|nr:bifunctional (p)ppGpp synthetase/guanosine-3',5'-bis(diphosphate) 3'-pyrophosphohydrolase [Chloroflexota bacterium]